MQSTSEVINLTVRRIEQRLGKTLEIPPLSLTAQKILKLRASPDIHVDQLTAIIEADPALAAQVMSWAASPYYASKGKISSVEDAIVRALGFDMVMGLALGLALGKKFSLPRSLQDDSIVHWKRALLCASLIEGLLRQLPAAQRPEPGLAYLTGLLHNFGYLLLAYLFPPYFGMIQTHQQNNPELCPLQIDQELLGMTRNDICASLMHLWNMPEELIVAIAEQSNRNYQGSYDNYVQLLQLANLLLNSEQNDDSEEQLQLLCQALGLQPEAAQQALDRVLAAQEALRSLSEQMGS